MKYKEYPKTVNASVDILIKELPPHSKRVIANLSKEQDMIKFHFSLGMAIRNNFGLWTDNEDLLLDCKELAITRGQNLTSMEGYELKMHPDDASHTILIELWRRIKE